MMNRILFTLALLVVGTIAFAQDGVINPQTNASALTTGTLPVARGGTNYAGAAWTTYTATLVPTSGSITSQGGTAASIQVGKWVCVSLDVSVTNPGTGTAPFLITLPAAVKRRTNLIGREVVLTGKVIAADVGAGGTAAALSNYDNTPASILATAEYVFDTCYEAN